MLRFGDAGELSERSPLDLAHALGAEAEPLAVWSYVWLALQIWNWWVPYLLGGARGFSSEYARTLHPLPELAGRPGPDAQHLVLEALSLAMAVAIPSATLVVISRRRRARDAGHRS